VLEFLDTTHNERTEWQRAVPERSTTNLSVRRLSADMIEAIIEESERHIHDHDGPSRNVSLCSSYYYDAVNGEYVEEEDDDSTVFQSFVDGESASFYELMDDNCDDSRMDHMTDRGGHAGGDVRCLPGPEMGTTKANDDEDDDHEWNLSQLVGEEYLDGFDSNHMEDFCEQLRQDLETMSDVVLGRLTSIHPTKNTNK
jgi:hypothetical protein